MSHIHSRYRQLQLEREHAEKVRRALRDSIDQGESVIHQSKLPGDPWALRGIPALTRGGIGGAIAGTRPDTALLATSDPPRYHPINTAGTCLPHMA